MTNRVQKRQPIKIRFSFKYYIVRNFIIYHFVFFVNSLFEKSLIYLLKGEIKMLLNEANTRLETVKINEDQLWALNSLYILLDLDKDDFCKIVDAVGVDKLLSKQNHYERLDKAEQELTAKEKYLKAKNRLEELESEKQSLENIVNSYKAVK